MAMVFIHYFSLLLFLSNMFSSDVEHHYRYAHLTACVTVPPIPPNAAPKAQPGTAPRPPNQAPTAAPAAQPPPAPVDDPEEH